MEAVFGSFIGEPAAPGIEPLGLELRILSNTVPLNALAGKKRG